MEEDIKKNPRSTSFFRAMQMSQGVLLVLDSCATPFERIWCAFEEAIVEALGQLLGLFGMTRRNAESEMVCK